MITVQGEIGENIRRKKHSHAAYQEALWDRFGPMFTGLRGLRDLMILPLFNDYALWLMRQHRLLTSTTMRIAQGITPPENVLAMLQAVLGEADYQAALASAQR